MCDPGDEGESASLFPCVLFVPISFATVHHIMNGPDVLAFILILHSVSGHRKRLRYGSLNLFLNIILCYDSSTRQHSNTAESSVFTLGFLSAAGAKQKKTRLGET